MLLGREGNAIAKRSKQFESELRWLRKAFPVGCRVYVKVCPSAEIRNKDEPDSPGNDGRCHYLEKSFRILVASELSEDMKVVTLYHEWAHAMAFPLQNRKHHIKTWQLAYGAIAAAREKRLGNP